MVAVGVGMALLQTPTMAHVGRVVPHGALATANGLYITGTFLGGALGATVALAGWAAGGGVVARLSVLPVAAGGMVLAAGMVKTNVVAAAANG